MTTKKAAKKLHPSISPDGDKFSLKISHSGKIALEPKNLEVSPVMNRSPRVRQTRSLNLETDRLAFP